MVTWLTGAARRWSGCLFVVVAGLALLEPAAAQPTNVPDGKEAALKQLATFKKPDGLQVELFAAEPILGNPVAIGLDEQGRVFVAEEYRFNRGAEENRSRGFFLEDDLQIKTLADRLAMFKKYADKFEGGFDWFTKQSDQIRRVEDRDGDGKADHSTVFATGFNEPLDGLAAGVMARNGDVYFTCIPHLWRLRDKDNDGVADAREKLLSGFGVNCAYLGHDLHGLIFGPDGRLYFSIGDRGFDVDTKEGTHVATPRRGAVFRCEPDGTQLEVVAIGLRNPQELAFDEYGRLFADDNNCDKGDHARLVYVLPGGDTGWDMAYQTIPEPYLVGPWHAEKLWHLQHPGQAAYILPPVGKIGTGPSGFAYDPGIGLPERYRGHFFMCNYTGNGGVESFAIKPNGAGFEIVDYHDLLKPSQFTDCEFGYDGKLYCSDFGPLDWNSLGGRGRIFTLFDPKFVGSPAQKELTTLFKEGFDQRPKEELAKLLEHADMRVRQRAQFALAARGLPAVPVLLAVAEQGANTVTRLHGVWGLGQIARQHQEVFTKLLPFLNAAAPEVRAQTAQIFGDSKYQPAGKQVLALLGDAAPQVQLAAALALRHLQPAGKVDALFALLARNANRDPFLRHGCIQGLAGAESLAEVIARATSPDAAQRLAVLLVLRLKQDDRILQFLRDPDLDLATEAARAINDLHMEVGQTELAKLLPRLLSQPGGIPDPLARRAINAAFRQGTREDALAVAAAVYQPNCSAAVRAEALAALQDWAKPGPRDRVTGKWRPLPARDAAVIKSVVETTLPQLLTVDSQALLAKVTALISVLGIQVDDSTFAAWIPDPQRGSAARIEALKLLANRKSDKLDKSLELALSSEAPDLRSAARSLWATKDASRGLALWQEVLKNDQAAVVERQAALVGLSELKSEAADQLLLTWLQKLPAGQVPAELQLDLVEAATARKTPALQAGLEALNRDQKPDDPLAKFRYSHAGGDVERGRALFVGHRTAQCMRCHKAKGEGGDAGPDLTQVATRHPRAVLVESLLDPNAKIAPNFGTVTFELSDGRVLAGTIKSETPTHLEVFTTEQTLINLAKADIEEQTAPKSLMPSVAPILTPRELRDVVEYLSTLK